MRVILLQEVKGTGKRGDIKEVPSGFAMNYLIKNGFAALATDQKIAQVKRKKEHLVNKLTKREHDCLKALKKFSTRPILIKKKANEDGILYGAVTKDLVLEALNDQAKANCAIEHISLHEPIKKIGTYIVSVHTKDKSTLIHFNIEILPA